MTACQIWCGTAGPSLNTYASNIQMHPLFQKIEKKLSGLKSNKKHISEEVPSCSFAFLKLYCALFGYLVSF